MKTYLYFICFITIVFGATAEEPKQTVCVSMIVKNESKVITRCLASLKPIIDYWVILDTGSTDGTQKIIKDFMKDIPGELHEEPFVNFAYSRNSALDLAKNKADYIMIIDADEVFSYDENFKFPKLDKDFYHIMTSFGGTEYTRVQLVKNSLNWRWEGVLHEAIVCSDARTCELLQGIKNVVRSDGARSTDPEKFKKDAMLLEKALKEEPDNSRYIFYLAQSYKDYGDHEKALEWYKKRIDLGGWDQEVFWSMLQVAKMQQALNMPHDTIITGYYNAYHFRPSRAEPLYYLANYYRLKGDYAASYLVSSVGVTVPQARDILFVEKWIQDFGLPLEFSVSAYWVGKYEECKTVSNKLLTQKDLPDGVKECVERNVLFANKKMLEKYRTSVVEN